MFALWYSVAGLAILLGAKCITMNAKPYTWQWAPFVIALLIAPILMKYGHKRWGTVIVLTAVVGLAVAILQIEGVIQIGQSNVLPVRE